MKWASSMVIKPESGRRTARSAITASASLAVVTRRFGELVQLQEDVQKQDASPCQRVRVGCLAYCEFGLTYQGHYQVMFASPLPLPRT